MPPKLAKPDSTAKPDKKVKLEKTAKPVNTVIPIKTSSPSMKKTSNKFVKREISENGHKSADQSKVKKEHIEAAGSSAPSSSNAVPSYDEADSKDVKKEEISSDSETDNKDKARKPKKNQKVKSEESDEDEKPLEKKDEVEDIVGRRLKGDIVQFRVKWKGYSLAETTWEPIENLRNAQELVNEFEAKRMAEAEKRAEKNSTKEKQSGTTKIDPNYVMTGVIDVAPSKQAWILEFDNILMPVSQAKVMLFPAKEKAMCVEFLLGYIHKQENKLNQAKMMLQELKE